MPEELTEEYWKQLRSAVLRNEVEKVQAESKDVVAETGNLQKRPVRADFQLVNQGR